MRRFSKIAASWPGRDARARRLRRRRRQPAATATAAATTAATTDGDGPKVGIAYDVGGRGDQSFNDSAWAAMRRPSRSSTHLHRGQGPAARTTPPGRSACASWPTRLQPDHRASASSTPPACPKVAAGVPRDQLRGHRRLHRCGTPATPNEPTENVVDLTFAAEQGSFLVGVAAALKTEDQARRLRRRQHTGPDQQVRGRLQGGRQVGRPEHQGRHQVPHRGPDATSTGFENPTGGKTAAEGMFDKGADIIYHAAGKSGLGVFDAVVAAGEGNWAIGVDSDQYLTVTRRAAAAHPDLDAQARRHGGLRVHQGVRRRAARRRASTVYDLTVDGVGYSTSGGFVDDIKDQTRRGQGRDQERRRSRCPTTLDVTRRLLLEHSRRSGAGR